MSRSNGNARRVVLTVGLALALLLPATAGAARRSLKPIKRHRAVLTFRIKGIAPSGSPRRR